MCMELVLKKIEFCFTNDEQFMQSSYITSIETFIERCLINDSIVVFVISHGENKKKNAIK